MERIEYFENYLDFGKRIKKIVGELSNAKIFIFGSVIRGDFAPGLSDIDVAIVSDAFKNRNLRLTVLDRLLDEFFFSPFEFHVLTEKQWKFYTRFIDELVEIE
jgi:hypothetical protein